MRDDQDSSESIHLRLGYHVGQERAADPRTLEGIVDKQTIQLRWARCIGCSCGVNVKLRGPATGRLRERLRERSREVPPVSLRIARAVLALAVRLVGRLVLDACAVCSRVLAMCIDIVHMDDKRGAGDVHRPW